MALVTAYRSISILDQLHLTWQSLLGQSAEVTPFQTLEWYRYILTRSDLDLMPLVLRVDNGDRTVGLLPLMVRRRATSLGMVRELITPPAPTGSLFRPIGRSMTATLIASLRFLARRLDLWDIAEWDGIDVHELDRGRTRDAYQNANLPIRTIGTAESWRWNRIDQTLKDEHAATARSREELFSNEEHRSQGWHFETVITNGRSWGDGDPNWEAFDRLIGSSDWQATRWTIPLMRSHTAPQKALEQLHSFASERGEGAMVVGCYRGEPKLWQYFLRYDQHASCVGQGLSEKQLGRDDDLLKSCELAALKALSQVGCQTVEFPVGCGRINRSLKSTHLSETGRDFECSQEHWQGEVVERQSIRSFARVISRARLVKLANSFWQSPTSSLNLSQSPSRS